MNDFCVTALSHMPKCFIDDKSTLVEVMAWCRQASSSSWPSPSQCHHHHYYQHQLILVVVAIPITDIIIIIIIVITFRKLLRQYQNGTIHTNSKSLTNLHSPFQLQPDHLITVYLNTDTTHITPRFTLQSIFEEHDHKVTVLRSLDCITLADKQVNIPLNKV